MRKRSCRSYRDKDYEESSEDKEYEESSDSDYEDIDDRPRKNRKTMYTKFENEIHKIRKYIEDRDIDLVKIIDSNLNMDHKSRLLQLYEIYKHANPLTKDALDLKKQLNDEYTQYVNEYKFNTEEYNKQITNINKFSTSTPLKYQIIQLDTSDSIKSVIQSRYEKLRTMDKGSEEYVKLHEWIQWAVKLPYNKINNPNINIKKVLNTAQKVFDTELHGLDSIKEQLMVYINARLTNPNMKACSLGLIGPSGIGKTTIARCISKAFDCAFEQISFGGVTSPDFIKGFNYTYIGAQPGEIVKALCRMGSKNGVIFIDELEKCDKKLYSALLHIIDPSQNSQFKDNYLDEIPIDLSSIFFIHSVNTKPEDSALNDRIFYIHIEDYTLVEKREIAKIHLLPKILDNLNLKHTDIRLSDDIYEYIVGICVDSSGVRDIHKTLSNIVNKIHYLRNYPDGRPSFYLKKRVKYPFKPTLRNIKMMIH
jgi:ATP-dependent Lon protease